MESSWSSSTTNFGSCTCLWSGTLRLFIWDPNWLRRGPVLWFRAKEALRRPHLVSIFIFFLRSFENSPFSFSKKWEKDKLSLRCFSLSSLQRLASISETKISKKLSNTAEKSVKAGELDCGVEGDRNSESDPDSVSLLKLLYSTRNCYYLQPCRQ